MRWYIEELSGSTSRNGDLLICMCGQDAHRLPSISPSQPHLPFHFPAEFGGVNIWEKYGPTEDIALPKHQSSPEGMPPIAFTYEMDGKTQVCTFGECVAMPGPDNGTLCPFCGPALPDNMTKTMRKGVSTVACANGPISLHWINLLPLWSARCTLPAGAVCARCHTLTTGLGALHSQYYSAVSWVDFLVGQMLNELDNLGHTEDTVVALVGDHGRSCRLHPSIYAFQRFETLRPRV